jgi:Glycosyl transferase family 2
MVSLRQSWPVLAGNRARTEQTQARACVIVPVRNEAETIEATLNALVAQEEIDRGAFEIIVLANNCDDDSAKLARAFGRSHPDLNLEVIERTFSDAEATIGNVRRLLMDEAARRLPAGGIIASTDGDTIVQRDWLAATFREFARGVDLVGGRILARSPTNQPANPALRRIHLADTTYRYLMAEVEDLIDPDPADPWPRHFQHFGASLAITREAYLGVGGLPRVPWLEDIALYDELRRADAAIRHSPKVRVATSERLGGRVGVGFSTQLSEWQALIEAGRPSIVESVAFVIERARERRRLRDVWTNAQFWKNGLTFGCFFESEISEFRPSAERLETLDDAIRHLRQALADLRRVGRAPLLSDSFEEIAPVHFRATLAHMAERSA